MKKFPSIVAGLVLVVGLNLAAIHDADAGRRHRGAAVVGGILGAIALGAIVHHHNRHYYDDDYYAAGHCYRGPKRCRWREKCWINKYGEERCKEVRRCYRPRYCD